VAPRVRLDFRYRRAESTGVQLEMQVTGLTIDPVNNAPIVVLREKDGSRILPIWIGVIEASAIAFELEQVKLTRPMTHDLLKTTVESLGASVVRVAVVDLKENTYFASIVLDHDGETIEIDARPSDAIALALRVKTPIFCESTVLEQAHLKQEEWEARKAGVGPAESTSEEPETDSAAAAPPDDIDRGDDGPRPLVEDPSKSLKELLEDLDPEDFGKYKM
jgi:hypothetical protein